MVDFVRESLDRRREELASGREVERQRDEIQKIVQASIKEVSATSWTMTITDYGQS